MWSIQRQENGSAFLQVAEDALRHDEAANNLIYGIARRLVAEPDRFDQLPYLATVHGNGAIICAALMTPPHRLVVFAPTPDPAAFDLLIADLQQDGWRVPGVTAQKAAARLFAERWQAITGESYGVDAEMRVFALHAVTWPPLPPGRMRQAGPEDEALVYQWYCDFNREAIPSDPMPTREGVRRSLAAGAIFLWNHGGAVSLAARGRGLPRGHSVGPVYTPPTQRGRGYAAACVATLSQALLDGGAQYCTLFTDLANPTSNAIYQRIGYRPVCDYTEYSFELSDAS